jgi:hypothetical protein
MVVLVMVIMIMKRASTYIRCYRVICGRVAQERSVDEHAAAVAQAQAANVHCRAT